ncbi:unnamed protein product, partial [Tuber aestivum]
MSLPLEEIRGHPAWSTVIQVQTPSRQGAAPVAKNRSGGPINIAYEVHGTGAIHIVVRLRSAFPPGHEHEDKYTSLVFDSRGVGNSDKPYARYSTSEMAKDVIDLLQHVGWTDPNQLHVIGVSMGGMIAQELAFLIPDRIASLCLQSTAARLVSSIPWYKLLYRRAYMLVPRSLPARLAAAQENIFTAAWLKAPDDLGVFPTNSDRYVAEELWRVENLPPPVYQGFLLQGLAASWHYMGPERLKVLGQRIRHILVCTGDLDAMIECRHSDVLVRGIAAGGRVVKRVFEGCGHGLQFQCAREYNCMIEEFVTAAHEDGKGATINRWI